VVSHELGYGRREEVSMKKFIIAPLVLAALFAVTGINGSGATQSAAAAEAPEWGACRWYCNNGTSFQTLPQCQAVCGSECEKIC
jgi:hypothetical protein